MTSFFASFFCIFVEKADIEKKIYTINKIIFYAALSIYLLYEWHRVFVCAREWTIQGQ